jgi:hypothetical protein
LQPQSVDPVSALGRDRRRLHPGGQETRPIPGFVST